MSKKFSEKWKEEKEAKKRKRLEKDGVKIDVCRL